MKTRGTLGKIETISPLINSDESITDESLISVARKGESKRRRPKAKPRLVEFDDELFDDRDTVVQDNSFNKQLIREISMDIRRVYNKTVANYDQLIDNEMQTDYMTLLNSAECCSSDALPFQMSKITNPSKTTTVNHDEPQTVPVTCIEGPDALPPMAYWVHIESNVKADDNLRLTHVPYLNEDQDDEKLCAALINLFEEGIHGYSENWRYINDWILFKIINELKATYLDRIAEFYFAFYQLFPNKHSHRQLPEIYAELCERWPQLNRIGQREKPIYPPDRGLNEHSVHSMNCIQCLSYDCPFHGFVPSIPSRFGTGSWHRLILPLPSNRSKCSNHCFNGLSRDHVLDLLGADVEDCVSNGVEVFIEKASVLRVPIEDGSSLISLLSLNPSVQEDFCLIARKRWAPYVTSTTTCRGFYEIILKFCRRPSDERLHADRAKLRVAASQMQRNFRNITWSTGVGQIQNQYRMDPCDHPGACGPSNKRCVCNKNGVCTKFCTCDDMCKMKFPGCRCTPGQCRTKQCQCFFARWECDPMICKSCKCDNVDAEDKLVCRNSSITKGQQKKIQVMLSQVAGWGAFIMEDAEKGELVSEYTGEVISASEVERRGHIYDKFKTSYIFSLNEDQCVDANKMGNLIRFANHSDNHSNCYSKILIVNGQHRIGIFAKTDLKYGDELLFDYSYNKQHKEEFVANDRFGNSTKKQKKKRSLKQIEATDSPRSSGDDSDEELSRRRNRKVEKRR